jgi:hypothetical protein
LSPTDVILPEPQTGEFAHIASHRWLVELPAVTTDAPAALDGVIVPATRPDASLAHAAGVAGRAGCPLVVLCSKGITATAAVAMVSRLRPAPRVVAVDVRDGDYGTLDVKLRTSDHRLATHGRGDASHKRNVGVLLARLLGWRTVLFLDDDVVGMDNTRLARTRELLAAETPGGTVEAVGWSFDSFADNSVVCHASRSMGGYQDTFIGGGGLATRVHGATPFFPKVYNEDWLFLFDLVAQGRVVLAGGLCQLPYDPFDHAERAETQEFGDLFAESLFSLLHRPAPRGRDVEALIEPARRERWWRSRIEKRAKFIARIDDRCIARGYRESTPIRASLDQAWQTLHDIRAADLVDYVDAWRADLADWRRGLAALPQTGLREALDLMRLDGVGDVPRRTRFSGRGAAGSRAPSRP